MEKFCQSCAMPLKAELQGTRADGSLCEKYCIYCYQKGEFTDPNLTMQDMINKLIVMHDKMNMTEEEAELWANKTLPTLKRWKKKEKGCGCCCKGH